jgi:hypothetical protein
LRALDRIFVLKRDKVRENGRKHYNEELHNCSPLNTIIIVIMIKSKRMMWARHIAHMKQMGNAY